MKIDDTQVDHGGLMRCCLETLHSKLGRDVLNGDILPCNHCNESMILVDGVWRWNSPLKEMQADMDAIAQGGSHE